LPGVFLLRSVGIRKIHTHAILHTSPLSFRDCLSMISYAVCTLQVYTSCVIIASTISISPLSPISFSSSFK
jgi:hypothetical protein